MIIRSSQTWSSAEGCESAVDFHLADGIVHSLGFHDGHHGGGGNNGVAPARREKTMICLTGSKPTLKWRLFEAGLVQAVANLDALCAGRGKQIDAGSENVAGKTSLLMIGFSGALRREPSVGLTPGSLAERGMLTTAGMTGPLDRPEAAGLI